MLRSAFVGLTAVWLIAGCASAQSPNPATPGAADERAASPEQGMAPVTDEPASPDLGNLALDIASDHLSVPTDELELVRVEPVQWRDSSLGCPEPGMNYMHVITPGHLALVRHGAATVEVHMSGRRGFVCEKRPAKAFEKGLRPLPTFSQPQLEALARADLAHRLAARPDEVSVVRSRSVVWPDASLGCGGADEAPSGGATKGFVITLDHDGREYVYHADLRHAVPCPPIEGS